MPKIHVRDSVRQVNVDSWCVGERIRLVRSSQKSPGCWSDGEGSFFTASESEAELSEIESSGDHPFKKVYDAGDKHVVWQIGKAFLKVVDLDAQDVTREHTTLQFLQGLKLDFLIPEILFHGEWDGRYYLVVSQIPGKTLNELWPGMSETAKSGVVRRVSTVCESLTTAVAATAPGKAAQFGGVDGQNLLERYMVRGNSPMDFNSSILLRNCHEIGMDCSAIVFHHCDLGPTNILLDADSLGIIDWECAGFVPREWIRTKFRICGGMDLENDETLQNPEAKYDYRSRVAAQLGEDGFHDCAMKWMQWRGLA